MFIQNNFRLISAVFILIGISIIVYMFQNTKEWDFNRIVIVIAISLFLFMLVLIGYLVHKSKYELKWPPVIPDCPDYWELEDGTCVPNQKNTNVGTCNERKYRDFVRKHSESELRGPSGIRKKAEWANKCGIVWDGITNNPEVINYSLHN